ncbi:di-trans,poly-cis-decaprenylcistransferase [Virgibacillus phasianinus]|uniref:Isoprenyl transferase n=1 Tax=Virgibacillus phasianinus TaxID=2017483 RepID=A0A220U775_9BACI|nr:isoprenyl transferase [Virgibacillus phasianinus]ASK63977.1 di-trans,poly-cis-decaprenylcistransferase [Virgibacillus phasianinus]
MYQSSFDHVAIIMDGNGRWGKKRHLIRSEGHYAGSKRMEEIIDASIGLNIKVLTLYAFSSENWSRPYDEVNYLMELPVRFFNKKLPEFMRRNIQIRISGNTDPLPDKTREVLDKAVASTANNTGIIVNFAFNYGGRGDIIHAAKTLIKDVRNGKISEDEITEERMQQYLYTGDLPSPDMIIRTGGEKRISNFLLWQSAESELYFSDVYFPDFTSEMLAKAIGHKQVNSYLSG